MIEAKLELIHELFSLLSTTRFTINEEKRLQREMKEILTLHYPEVESEKRLDSKNIIDFVIDGVGIEVKVKGSKKEIYKQCVRYCEFDEIKALILVSSVMTGFPKEINGKSCYVLRLSKAWL